jgi:replicative DNA helicase
VHLVNPIGALPASQEAERALLGSTLFDNESYIQMACVLLPEDFLLDSHQRIFACMGRMLEAGRAVDIVTLSNELSASKEIHTVGGAAYLASLTEGLPRHLNVAEYTRIVKEKSLLRQTAKTAERMQAAALDQSEDVAAVLGRAQADLDRLSERTVDTTLQTLGAYFSRAYPSIEQYNKRNAREQGLATGFTGIDLNTCGLQRKNLIILAARPGMGKTAWAMNVAAHAALKLRKTVAVFSMEMSTDELLDRMVCASSGVPLATHRDHRGGDDARYALSELLDAPIYIDDTPNQTMAQIFAKANQLKQQGLDLVVVDYLQLMHAPPSKTETREQQVGGFGRGLKSMAKKLDIPVLALSQLKRPQEKGGGVSKPRLSDLRESGSLEQDADLVLLIHRDSYYGTDDEEKDEYSAEILIAKQRQGAMNVAVPCYFQGSCTRFTNDHPTRGRELF